MKYDHDGSRRADADGASRERTTRRLLVVRLRVEIATRQAAQPSDPRIGQARRELRVLTGAARDTD